MAITGLILLTFFLLLLRQNLIVILLVGAAYVHMVWGGGRLDYLAEDMWIGLNSEALLAVPMFIAAGNVFSRGAIAKRLVRIMTLATAPLPGGLGAAAILSCAVFAAVSGSSAATLLAIGPVMYPAMIEQGYSRNFALGALTSAGTLGIIIPPSIPMIVYGIVSEVSIADLFLAGLIPGLLLAGVLAAYAVVANRRLPARLLNGPELAKAIAEGVWSLLMPVMLLGGIFSGYFSPTESAVVALLYGIFVEAVVHREIGFEEMRAALMDTARMLGVLLPIVAVALSLKSLLTVLQVPQQFTIWMTETVSNGTIFILAVNLILLCVGCLFDALSAIVILGPLLMPQAVAYGFDPVHFGVIMVMNLEIGLLTPPLGINLFVAMMAFRADFSTVVRAVAPFAALILAVLLAVTFLPALSLALL
ncbi:TRAP transporter large permease [Amaricoccus tamworthensis]|uniref:TRAP transporter large permease n=1 Tax=Amaricoccus tamworthensis TaxID=57002 RepID=UPI003C797F32